MPLVRAWKRLVDRVVCGFLVWAGPLNSPRLSAHLFSLGIHRSRKESSGQSPERFAVLGLSKAMFTEDMETAFPAGSGVAVFHVHRDLVKRVSHRFLPVHLDDGNYLTDNPADEDCKRRCRRFWLDMWPHVASHRRYDAVLTGNFAYHAEREMAAALETLGVPFIAIHKECVRSPAYAEFFGFVYRKRRGPFSGRRILCYDEQERDLEIQAGVASAEQVTVTGMPRLDFVHAARREAASRGEASKRQRQVLFLSFGVKSSLPELVRKMSGPPYTRYKERLEPELESLNWARLHAETHQALLRLALEAPDIDVVVKTKGGVGEHATDVLRDILKVDRLPPNLRVIYGGNPHRLLLDSDAICGFNSTSLLEAIAADRPVVVPRFAEAAEPRMGPYLIDYENAVEYANSPEDLTARLIRHARSPRPPRLDLPEESRRVLKRWLHNDDGRAGERVRAAVLAEIEHCRGRSSET